MCLLREVIEILSIHHFIPNMITSTQFIFWLAILLLGTTVQKTHPSLTPPVYQNSSFISASNGETVILHCFHIRKDWERICWYRQTLGQQPNLIASFYVYGQEPAFYDEFKNNSRLSLIKEDQTTQLIISNLRNSDSATYYCATSNAQIATFAQGTVVNVKSSDADIKALVQQLAPESLEQKGSTTLKCTIQTGSYGGEHTVYWFKDSDGFRPGFIYTHESRNDQGERNSNKETHTCVYNLPVNNLNVYDQSTYYCAVASCGHILFVNSTRQNLSREKKPFNNVVVGASTGFLTTVLVASMVTLVCRLRTTSIQAKDLQCSADMNTQRVNPLDTNTVFYASVKVDKSNRSRRQRNSSKDECVYSSLSQKK